MPGNILLFGHVNSADTVNQFLADLAQAFQDLGRNSILTLIDDRAPFSFPHHMIEEAGTFAIDINSKILSGNFPKISLMVDHPLSHIRLLRPGTRTVLGLIDQGHCALAPLLKSPCAFVPHGGPPVEAGCLERPRDIDVLFVGNILDEVPAASADDALALEIGRKAAASAMDPFPPLHRAMGPRMPIVTRHLLDLATNEAQRLARSAALASIRVPNLHVVGYVPPELKAALPHAVFYGVNGSFTESRALMRRAKVLVNVSQKFPRGSHERIWYGMAAGCCLVTNRSSFVERDFRHGESILFYDDPAQVGDLVARALERDLWRSLAAASLSPYEAGHTWLERAERILVAMIGRGA